MLWVDKHRPLSLDDLDFQVDQAQQLKKLVSLLFLASPWIIITDNDTFS